MAYCLLSLWKRYFINAACLVAASRDGQQSPAPSILHLKKKWVAVRVHVQAMQCSHLDDAMMCTQKMGAYLHFCCYLQFFCTCNAATTTKFMYNHGKLCNMCVLYPPGSARPLNVPISSLRRVLVRICLSFTLQLISTTHGTGL